MLGKFLGIVLIGGVTCFLVWNIYNSIRGIILIRQAKKKKAQEKKVSTVDNPECQTEEINK